MIPILIFGPAFSTVIRPARNWLADRAMRGWYVVSKKGFRLIERVRG